MTLTRRATLLICMMLCAASVSSAHAPAIAAGMEEAMEWCDENTLDPVEGIWQMAEENVLVLVARNSFKNMSDYSITVVDCYDAMTAPGEEVGVIIPTADARKYKVRLSTRRDSDTGQPAGFEECDATIDAEASAMTMKPRKSKFKFSFRPAMLFPRLWRVLSIKRSENADEPTKGMVKVYPSYDGNGSSRRTPRYL